MSENSPNNEVRRYVGRKETIAYVLNDVASSLNIDDYKERYIYDVVKIDFNTFFIFIHLLYRNTLYHYYLEMSKHKEKAFTQRVKTCFLLRIKSNN